MPVEKRVSCVPVQIDSSLWYLGDASDQSDNPQGIIRPIVGYPQFVRIGREVGKARQDSAMPGPFDTYHRRQYRNHSCRFHQLCRRRTQLNCPWVTETIGLPCKSPSRYILRPSRSGNLCAACSHDTADQDQDRLGQRWDTRQDVRHPAVPDPNIAPHYRPGLRRFCLITVNWVWVWVNIDRRRNVVLAFWPNWSSQSYGGVEQHQRRCAG